MRDEQSNLISIDVEEEALAASQHRAPLVASIGVLLLCALVTPMPFFIRTGTFGFVATEDVAVIPYGVFWTFLASTLAIGGASIAVLYGRRVLPGVFLLPAVIPLAAACVGAFFVGIASVPSTEVRPDSEAFRVAAESGPYILA